MSQRPSKKSRDTKKHTLFIVQIHFSETIPWHAMHEWVVFDRHIVSQLHQRIGIRYSFTAFHECLHTFSKSLVSVLCRHASLFWQGQNKNSLSLLRWWSGSIDIDCLIDCLINSFLLSWYYDANCLSYHSVIIMDCAVRWYDTCFNYCYEHEYVKVMLILQSSL